MKKIVFISLLALCFPWTLMAQSADDDLYYVPSKRKAEQKTERTEEKTVRKAPENVIVVETQEPVVCTNSGTTPVVVKDKKGNVRDVDEYNRRYNSNKYDFSQNEDTLYIEEKAVSSPEGEWVNGFDGSEDDYEYAMRIIRFRNPRYAISISSPLYWDVVYGLNSWDWNVYTDGLYAYAFPTFTNRLWWDWRYNSFGWSWSWPYYGWNWGWSGLHGGWYGGWYAGWGGWYGGWGWYHYHHPYYYPGWHHPGPGYWASHDRYTTRRSYGGTRSVATTRTTNGGRSTTRTTGGRRVTGQPVRQTTGSSIGRVVGTRTTTARQNSGTVVRSTSTDARRSTYTRPSTTRSNSYNTDNRTSTVQQSGASNYGRRSAATYNRGSSNQSSRSYQSQSRQNSYDDNSRSFNNTTTRSSSRSSFSTGGSTRSSGSYGTSRSSGGGGGSSRRR